MEMGTQGAGRKRLPNRERLTAEDEALNQIAREAEARLAAKRAARAEAREIRMRELERQQKEIYQVQKKYYGLDTKWGDIEQWMEDSERYSHRSRRNTSASDEDERVSVGSHGSLRTNGYDGELYGSQSLSRRSGRNSSYSGDSRSFTLSSSREEKLVSVFDDSSLAGARRGSAYGSHAPSEHSGHLNSSSRASSRASSARASPVVEERPEKDFTEKGSRNLPSLSAATLASLGGTSSRRGSGDTSISIDTEASIREIKELNEIKDQIQDVEGKYMQGLKELKDSLAEVEEKYKKAMVSNAQLDNEKTNYMYQVDTLKDTLLELEEQLAESRRQYEEKSKEFEREKHAHGLLRFQFAEVRAALQQREEMLEEIRQLQQKQASCVREISDLQETLEWKDRRIGALERQKEFFDSIRSERDDLREEMVVLKEELKKHGIILNSEIASNGETSDTLNNVGHQGPPSKMTKEELNALKTTGDGTLGKATTKVEVKKEVVENVGKREILQNPEQEQRKEDPVKDCADAEVSPPGENAEDQKAPEDRALSLETLANVRKEEQAQSQILASPSSLEQTEQVGSNGVVSTPDASPRASLEPSKCLSELSSESPGPVTGQGSGNALDIQNQRKGSVENQEQEKQGFKTSLGEVSTRPHQESAPWQTPEVEAASSSQGTVAAGQNGFGEQEGTVASSPPRDRDDTISHDKCVADVPKELDPSTRRGSKKELTSREAAEPREVPVQSTKVGEGEDEEEEEGQGFKKEKPARTEVRTGPSSPAAENSAQEATRSAMADAESEPLEVPEPPEEKTEQHGEGLASSQKKTKNKKKKNKKKKSPAPGEALKDDVKELTFQKSSDPSDVKEEEGQVKFTEHPSGGGTQKGGTGNLDQSAVAGSSDNLGCPEDPTVGWDGKVHQEEGDVNREAGKVAADGEPAASGDDPARASGSSARADGLEEGAGQDDASAAPSAPPETEDVSGSAPLPNASPSPDIHTASQTEGPGSCVTSEGPSQGARKALESVSLENDDPAPAGALGDTHAESNGEKRGCSDKDRSKEDCTLS